MASIKKALKNKTSYTNKHGLTFSFEELREIKRLNDQLNYYKKVNKLEIGKRIRPGMMANETASRVGDTKIAIKTGKYIRIRARLDKAIREKQPDKKITRLRYETTRAKTLLTQAMRDYGKFTNDFNIEITQADIEAFKRDVESGKLTHVKGGIAGINFKKLSIFKDNLLNAVESQFGGRINSHHLQQLKDIIDKLSAYELHRLATDNPTMIDFIYLPDNDIEWYMGDLLHKIESARSNNTINMKDIMEYYDNIVDDMI